MRHTTCHTSNSWWVAGRRQAGRVAGKAKQVLCEGKPTWSSVSQSTRSARYSSSFSHHQTSPHPPQSLSLPVSLYNLNLKRPLPSIPLQLPSSHHLPSPLLAPLHRSSNQRTDAIQREGSGCRRAPLPPLTDRPTICQGQEDITLPQPQASADIARSLGPPYPRTTRPLLFLCEWPTEAHWDTRAQCSANGRSTSSARARKTLSTFGSMSNNMKTCARLTSR